MRNMYKNSLIKKFKKSDLYNQDFPYILIENALDEDFYNKLSSAIPSLFSTSTGILKVTPNGARNGHSNALWRRGC